MLTYTLCFWQELFLLNRETVVLYNYLVRRMEAIACVFSKIHVVGVVTRDGYGFQIGFMWPQVTLGSERDSSK